MWLPYLLLCNNSFQDKLGELLSVLESLPIDTQVPSTVDLVPLPLLPEPTPPTQLWASRAVTASVDPIPEDHLSLTYWLQNIDTQESGTQPYSICLMSLLLLF